MDRPPPVLDFEGSPDPPPELPWNEENGNWGRSDGSLMRVIRKGDQDALGELIGRYWDPLVSYAAGFVVDWDDAQDVVQEAFVRVWRRRSKWVPSGSVASYLYCITRNLAVNARRKMLTKQKKEAISAADFFATAYVVHPDRDMEQESLRVEVEAAIAALPPRRREVFILCRFHRLSHREIAETMGIAVQTAANQMAAAFADLRKSLGHHLED